MRTFTERSRMNTVDKKQIQRLNERKIELIDEFVSRMDEINYQIKAIQRGEWTIVPREEKVKNDNT